MRRPRRLNYANVMATVAVFLALGGGALAAFRLPRNSVGTRQLKNGAVTSRKIRTGTINISKLSTAAIGVLRGQTGPRGPRGSRGPRGETGPAGATNVVTRYGPERTLTPTSAGSSYAVCHPGEAVTGGGYEFISGRPTSTDYYVTADRPSVQAPGEPPTFPPPADGARPAGWLVSIENDTTASFSFRSYAVCASP